jgi:hypothetical protein
LVFTSKSRGKGAAKSKRRKACIGTIVKKVEIKIIEYNPRLVRGYVPF